MKLDQLYEVPGKAFGKMGQSLENIGQDVFNQTFKVSIDPSMG